MLAGSRGGSGLEPDPSKAGRGLPRPRNLLKSSRIGRKHPRTMHWDEDPNYVEGVWRGLRSFVVLALCLGLVVAMITGDFLPLLRSIGMAALSGLVFLIVGLTGGLLMKALVSAGWGCSAWLDKLTTKLKH